MRSWSRRSQSRAVGRAGERGEIVAVEGDARESVAGGAPGNRDRRVGVRLAVTVRGRGQGARRARSAGVDPVGTGVHCGRAVAGGIAGPHVEVPVRAVGRGRAGEGRSRLLGRGIRHRRGSLIEGDRVARDAVGVDRTREGEIDVDVARPGREGMARRSDREAGRPGGVDGVGTARRDEALVPRPVDRADAQIPVPLAQYRRARRSPGRISSQGRAGRRHGAAPEVEAIAGDRRPGPGARWAPLDVDRRVVRRSPVVRR